MNINERAIDVGAEHYDGRWVFTDVELKAFARAVAAAEREACAKVCEDAAEYSKVSVGPMRYAVMGCAAAIRARAVDQP